MQSKANIRSAKGGQASRGINKELIKAIKNGVDLKTYIQSRGHAFKKAGQSYFCRCPFPNHEDKTPSFSVTPEKQLFHCFGCGRGGDVLAFVMTLDRVDFVEAVKRLEKEIIPRAGRAEHGGIVCKPSQAF